MANVGTPLEADKMTILERVSRVLCVDILNDDPDGGTPNLSGGETKAWEQFKPLAERIIVIIEGVYAAENAKLRRLNPDVTGYANGYADALDDGAQAPMTPEMIEVGMGMARSEIERIRKAIWRMGERVLDIGDYNQNQCPLICNDVAEAYHHQRREVERLERGAAVALETNQRQARKIESLRAALRRLEHWFDTDQVILDAMAAADAVAPDSKD